MEKEHHSPINHTLTSITKGQLLTYHGTLNKIIIVEGHPREKRRTIPVAIIKKLPTEHEKVASRPSDDLQTHPNTGSITSQNNWKLSLRILYHRLDIFSLSIYNIPSLLYWMYPITYPPLQASKLQSQNLHTSQLSPLNNTTL